MDIRITAETNQIEKISNIFNMLEIENSIYSNRDTTKTKRLYANVNDKKVDKQLDNLSSIISATFIKK